MNKYWVLALLSGATLSGCKTLESVSTLMNFSADPVVVASSKANATRQTLLATGVKPASEMATTKIKGSCLDYPLHKDDKSIAYYVALNDRDQVVAYGFTTCAQAESAGVIRNSEPPRSKSNQELLKEVL